MCELASVSHQLPSSCRSRVIFSLLSAAIAPDISIDEAIVQMTKAVKCFVFYLERVKIIWQLDAVAV